nr:MAG TPA: helix-turn-helix domain protein [Caudoviricetes sp.]
MNILEEYRQKHGLTYEQLAKLAGLSARSVAYAHCHGLRTISAESAIKYALTCGISLSKLRPDLWEAGASAPVEDPPPETHS